MLVHINNRNVYFLFSYVQVPFLSSITPQISWVNLCIYHVRIFCENTYFWLLRYKLPPRKVCCNLIKQVLIFYCIFCHDLINLDMSALSRRAMSLVQILWRRLRRSERQIRQQQEQITRLQDAVNEMKENMSILRRTNSSLKTNINFLQYCLETGQEPMIL